MSEAAAIGGRLRVARERLGIAIADAARSLHVDAAVIEALESGRFFALGAPVFARGYLRQYAQLVGESLDEITGRYETLMESAATPDLTDLPLMAAPSGPRRSWPLVLLATALILAVVIWWALGVKAA